MAIEASSEPCDDNARNNTSSSSITSAERVERVAQRSHGGERILFDVAPVVDQPQRTRTRGVTFRDALFGERDFLGEYPLIAKAGEAEEIHLGARRGVHSDACYRGVDEQRLAIDDFLADSVRAPPGPP